MSERDEHGRFKNGWKGGPGRPKREREERFLEIILSTVTADDWKKIVHKAADQAKRGNPIARKWLADYIVGVPVQRHEVQSESDVVIRVRWPDADIDIESAASSQGAA